PIKQRAGHDRAMSATCKHAIDGKAGSAAVAPFRRVPQSTGERRSQAVQTLAGRTAAWHDRAGLEARTVQSVLNFVRDQCQPIRIDEIGFVQSHYAMTYPKQVKNCHVL